MIKKIKQNVLLINFQCLNALPKSCDLRIAIISKKEILLTSRQYLSLGANEPVVS